MKLIYFFVVIGLLSCAASNESGTNPAPENEFGIYLLDVPFKTPTVWGFPLESLGLAPQPFIRARDLSAYSWSTHTFVPAPALDSVLKQMMTLQGKSWGVPFVVMVGNRGSRVTPNSGDIVQAANHGRNPPVDFQQSKPYLNSAIMWFEISRCSSEVRRDC